MEYVCITFISNNTFGLPVITKDTKCPSLVFYVWFVDIHTSWTKFVPELWFSPNDIRKCLLDVKHGWTKNAFWEVNNKKWRKLCVFVSYSLFKNTYGLPVLTLDTKCPNQVFYVRFVLYKGWKQCPLQIIIFVYVSSTWNIVELKRVLRRE
jgi:hypothetical protein